MSSPASPSSRRRLPRAATEFLSGSTAGLLTTLTLHPLDLLKIRLQVSSTRTSALEILRQVHRSSSSPPQLSKTVLACYRGLSANLAGNAGSWAVYFVLYGEAKAILERRRRGGLGEGEDGGRLGSMEFLLASGSAGIITQVLTNPLWVVKTRLLSTGRDAAGAYSGLFDGFKRILRDDGIRGLYRGLLPGMFGVAQGAVQFSVYEKLKHWRADSLPPSTPLSNTDVVALSASSKIVSGAVTYPYQVIRARLQAYDAEKAYRGVRDAVRKIWREEGGGGFYKGLGPGLVRVLPSTCITLLVYENCKAWLDG